MNKVMILPLDERPCNTFYIKFLMKDTPFQILMPPLEILGNKKQKANIESLTNWIYTNLDDVSHLILSIDMLVYGGIVPSRLHQDTSIDLLKRLHAIEIIKRLRPDIKIYAFNLIMRNPTYSSNDEEPDYYGTYGREIHLRGVYEHKQKLNCISLDEEKDYQRILQVLPEEIYADYTHRRSINLSINKEVISLRKQGLIDYLVIPQDDASPFGLTKQDQDELSLYQEELGSLHLFLMYPDADAVVNTLTVRAVIDILKSSPKIFVDYATDGAATMIPLFEDRPLKESIHLQILASGATQTTTLEEADLVLMINATSVMVDINASNELKYSKPYLVERDMDQFISRLQSYIKNKKIPVIIGDVAYSNGSDHILMKKLCDHNLLFQLAGYAAWNTSGNTLGTCIPQGILYHYYGLRPEHLNFLGLRYVEDFLYMSIVRKEISQDVLPKLGYNYFFVEDTRGIVSNLVSNRLKELIDEHFPKSTHFEILDCYMPWKRMFEVGLDVEVQIDYSLEVHTTHRIQTFKIENREMEEHQTVFLGDSITEHFPYHLVHTNQLIYNRGIVGDNIQGLLNRMNESIYQLNPDKVFLLIGTNDMCNGRSNDEIIEGIKEIIDKIHSFNPSIKVFVQSILPIHEKKHPKIVSDYIVCRSNQRFKEINQALSKLQNITFIDTFSSLTDQDGDLAIEYTLEGLHLSVLGYDQMIHVLRPYL